MADDTTTSASRPWWVEEQRRLEEEPAKAAKQRPGLGREQIVAAALQIVDDEGLDKLSMRRLASVLCCGATSLYWYVPNKDALLDLILEAVIGEMRHPEKMAGASWSDRLRMAYVDLRRTLQAHPNAMPLLSRVPTGPGTLPHLEGAFAALRDAGFSDDEAVSAHHLLMEYTIGCCTLHAGARDDAGEPTPPGEDTMGNLAGFFSTLPPDRFPNLRAVSDAFGRHDVTEGFEFGLACILDGLEARLDRSKAPG